MDSLQGITAENFVTNSLETMVKELEQRVTALEERLTKPCVCENAISVPDVVDGFSKLKALLKNGAVIRPGQKVDVEMNDGTTTHWTVVETRPEKTGGERRAIVVQTVVDHYSAFSDVSKQHPFGYNDYFVSKAREYMTTHYHEALKTLDYQAVIGRQFDGQEYEDDFWLLDAEEVEGENAFKWFRERKRRCLMDTDGDKCGWFLRGADPSNTNYVGNMSTSGALYYDNARYANGLVAACIIG